MEFDWLDAPFDLHALTPKEIQESFEDPFSLRLLPEVEIAGEDHARYFNLGCSVDERPVFSIFWTDGKRMRVIAAREMSTEEEAFYTRKKKEEIA
jgi:uncharacterized DUF497 family protein